MIHETNRRLSAKLYQKWWRQHLKNSVFRHLRINLLLSVNYRLLCSTKTNSDTISKRFSIMIIFHFPKYFAGIKMCTIPLFFHFIIVIKLNVFPTAIFGSVNLVHITRARGSVIINIFPISHCSVFTLLPKSEIWISFRF